MSCMPMGGMIFCICASSMLEIDKHTGISTPAQAHEPGEPLAHPLPTPTASSITPKSIPPPSPTHPHTYPCARTLPPSPPPAPHPHPPPYPHTLPLTHAPLPTHPHSHTCTHTHKPGGAARCVCPGACPCRAAVRFARCGAAASAQTLVSREVPRTQ